jgi:hypothetical protein
LSTITYSNEGPFALSILGQIVKSKEGTNRTHEQELSDLTDILLTNKEAKTKLHVLAGCEGDSCRSELVDNPSILLYLHTLKHTLLEPFVMSRLCENPKGTIIVTISKPTNVQPLLDILNDNTVYPNTSGEDSLLFGEFVNRLVTELTLKVPSDILADSKEAEKTITTHE